MLIGKGIEFCNSTSNTLVHKMEGYGDINFVIILLSDVILGCSLHSIDKLIQQPTYLPPTFVFLSQSLGALGFYENNTNYS